VDVVEYCPALDVNWTTADTVLRLLVNLLGVRSAEASGR
jgi:arginase family enzyme